MSVLIEGLDDGDSSKVTVTVVGVEGKGKSASCDAEYIGKELEVGVIMGNGMEAEWKGDTVRLGGVDSGLTVWKDGEMVGSLNGVEIIGLDVKMVTMPIKVIIA